MATKWFCNTCTGNHWPFTATVYTWVALYMWNWMQVIYEKVVSFAFPTGRYMWECLPDTCQRLMVYSGNSAFLHPSIMVFIVWAKYSWMWRKTKPNETHRSVICLQLFPPVRPASRRIIERLRSVIGVYLWPNKMIVRTHSRLFALINIRQLEQKTFGYFDLFYKTLGYYYFIIMARHHQLYKLFYWIKKKDKS